MRQTSTHITDHILAGVGLLVVLPAIYFFTGSVLKYELKVLLDVDIFVPPPVMMVGSLFLKSTSKKESR
ncbi:MAG: hypothetical protein NPIRA02_37210 [Nitrospirales bacterium]|nr:MAG: hypothetical protein NPIRA02_37210 [Nitrospirales bacterium]